MYTQFLTRRRAVLLLLLAASLLLIPLLLQLPSVLEWDADLFLAINSNYQRSELVDVFLCILTKFGGIPFLVVLSGLLYARGYRSWAYAIIAAIICYSAVGLGTRIFIDRPRPYITYPWIHHLQTVYNSSYPSGHSMGIASLCGILLAERNKLTIPMAIGVVAVPISRIYIGVHYPLDVVGGVMIGLLIGLLVGDIFLREGVDAGDEKRQNETQAEPREL